MHQALAGIGTARGGDRVIGKAQAVPARVPDRTRDRARDRAPAAPLLAAPLLAALLLATLVLPARAEGNLAARPEALAPLELKADLTMSQSEYRLKTGQAYRLEIASDGGEEFSFRAPQFFHEVWIDGVERAGVTIASAAVTAIDFEEAASVEILFVPVRPGRFDFWVEGYQTRGMLGHFVVE